MTQVTRTVTDHICDHCGHKQSTPLLVTLRTDDQGVDITVDGKTLNVIEDLDFCSRSCLLNYLDKQMEKLVAGEHR